MTSRRHVIAMIAVALLLFLMGLAWLPLPLTRDQGVYAYVAWRWLSGGLPYLDAFDHKGPLLYAIYALGHLVSGGATWGPQLCDLIAKLLAVLFTALTAAALRGSPAAAAAGTLAALLAGLPLISAFASGWSQAQAETFMLPLLAGAAWFCLRARLGLRLDFRSPDLWLAGLLLGQAIVLKPTAAIQAVLLGAWVVLAPTPRGAKRRLGVLVPLGLGLAAGVAVWLLYFLVRGGLGALWEAMVVFNRIHAEAALRAGGAAGSAFSLGEAWFWRTFTVLPLLVLALLPGLRRRDERGAVWLCLALVVGALLQVFTQRRFFEYHWLLLAPPLGLAGALFATGWGAKQVRKGDLAAEIKRGGSKGSNGHAAVRGALVVGLAALVLWYGAQWGRAVARGGTLAYVIGKLSREQFLGRYREHSPQTRGDFNLLASDVAARFARDATPANGRLLVFGFEPLVNYLARRPSPTRFIMDYPLTFAPLDDAAARLREKWRREFMADLRRRPPELIYIVDNDANPLEPSSSLKQAAEFSEFRTWLEERYRRLDALEDFNIHEPISR